MLKQMAHIEPLGIKGLSTGTALPYQLLVAKMVGKGRSLRLLGGE
jgi:hypothetical protein